MNLRFQIRELSTSETFSLEPISDLKLPQNDGQSTEFPSNYISSNFEVPPWQILC